MSLLRRSQHPAAQAVAERVSWRRDGVRVTQTDALRQSVVWAACRLRADLVSQLPVDVFRPSAGAGIAVEVEKPPVLKTPAQIAEGHPMEISEWIYSGQMSLDRHGNNFGVIKARDGLGLPSRIELVDPDEVTLRISGRQITEYRINGEKVSAPDVWHERQYTVAGLPVGLSPIAFAALSLAGGINAQRFAVDWFQNGAVPGAILKNTERTFTEEQADRAKRRFKAAIQNGDVFVTGKDWTYSAVQAKAAESQFLEQMRATDQDLCRFLGVPGDLVDVSVDSATINYANITQRNLQLLVMNLGPAIKRREDALSRIVPAKRYVKLNRAAILAMDEETRAKVMKSRIEARVITPDEARALEDRPPLTDHDYAQFEKLFGRRAQPRTEGGTP